ncbi:MAG: hypothetical protein ACK5NU_16290 [Fusobacterium ulcerans]|uniref:hypothetical protein n=1 Tax=Fusobacterium ulcerans TaxID=861 RepID=UPI003A8B4721
MLQDVTNSYTEKEKEEEKDIDKETTTKKDILNKIEENPDLEDAARGLCFEKTEMKNGKEYKSIRWATIKKYLEEIGFDNKLSKELKVIDTSVDGIGNTNLPEYIQKNIFYKLCMKMKKRFKI